MASTPEPCPRPLFSEAAVTRPCLPATDAAPPAAGPPGGDLAQPLRVRPLDLPPASAALAKATASAGQRARVTPLELPETLPPAPVARPSVKPLVLAESRAPDAAAAVYAPASLLFDGGKGSDLEQMRRRVLASLPQPSTRQLAVLDEAIRELLPVELSRLAAWGASLLRCSETITGELQRLTAVVAGWNVGDLIEKCHLAMAASGLWKLLRRGSPTGLKPALELVLAQAPQVLAALDELARHMAPCRDQFAAALLLLKPASEVLALGATEAEAFARRGHLLTVAAQHFDLLEPQLDQLRRQVVAWQSEIEQLQRVTIPLWELANSRSGG